MQRMSNRRDRVAVRQRLRADRHRDRQSGHRLRQARALAWACGRQGPITDPKDLAPALKKAVEVVKARRAGAGRRRHAAALRKPACNCASGSYQPCAWLPRCLAKALRLRRLPSTAKPRSSKTAAGSATARRAGLDRDQRRQARLHPTRCPWETFSGVRALDQPRDAALQRENPSDADLADIYAYLQSIPKPPIRPASRSSIPNSAMPLRR